MRWSSGFLKSSWTTLWSMYWTARSTRTRGTPSCSNCMKAIVPVASCSSVWSTRRPIGEPGLSSPSTRCSRRIWLVSESATRESYPCDREHASILSARGHGRAVARELDEGADRRARAQVELDVRGRPENLDQRGGQDAGVQRAVGALVVLLDEEAPVLDVQAEDVGRPAAEAEVVVLSGARHATSGPRAARGAGSRRDRRAADRRRI